jgi:hypothetical protein
VNRVTFDEYVTVIRTMIDEIAASPQPAPLVTKDDDSGTAIWQSPSGHTASMVTTLDQRGYVKTVRVFFDTFASDETWTPDQHGAEALAVRIGLRLEIEART